MQNTLRLLHNINFAMQEHQTNELISLLMQSDTALGDMNMLKNESDLVIAGNLAANPSLVNKLADATAEEDKKFRVFRRETPFTSARVAGSTPAWARGAAPAFSLGPFRAFDGRQFWFDFFRYTRLVSVFSGSDPAPVMLLPLKIPLLPFSRSHFDVAAGSVWIRADVLAAGVSKTLYTGLKINGGKITISEGHTIHQDKLLLAGSETFSLQLDLDNTHTATGASIFGIDARETIVSLPDAIELNFAGNKMSIHNLSHGQWTVYGEDRDFDWDSSQPVTFNGYLQRIVVPMQKGKPVCAILDCQSQFFNIDGKAAVLSAGWCLSVNLMDITKPFDVKGNGVFAILCTNGLSSKWKGLTAEALRVQFNFPLIMAEPGKLSVSDLAPGFQSLTENYLLWKRSADKDIRASVALFFRDNKPFNYYSDETGFEALSTLADCKFETDKPYRADGIPVCPETKDTFYLKYISDAGTVLWLYDADLILEINPAFKNVVKPEIYPFAISNAYMLTTPPASLMLAGTVDADNTLLKAQLNIAYGLFNLTPTLPDPYTSNTKMEQFGINAEKLKDIKEVTQWFPLLENYLMSKCTWEDGVDTPQGTVKVDFELLTELFRQLNNLPTGTAIDNQQVVQLMQEDIIEDFSLMEGITNNDIYGRSLFSLLDVSTNCDLFGVSMVWNSRGFRALTHSNVSAIGENIVTIDNMSLQAPMVLLNGFTLPHISWEPLNNLTPPETAAYPPKGVLGFPDNGPPSVFSQLDIKRIAIDPVKYLHQFRENIKFAAKPPFSYIIFGLPHGKVSLAIIKRFSDEFAAVSNNYNFIQPAFSSAGNGMKGGLQFRIAASNANKRDMLPGQTNQLKNLTDQFGNGLNKSVLGVSVHEIFQNDFYENFTTNIPEMKIDGVPVTHVDFSGYGASMFSDWHNPDAMIAQVSQVRFDVTVGRVSHEVVQVVSILKPWGIKVVRTVTFHRNKNSIIYREDSGWVAMSNGTFDFSFAGDIPDPGQTPDRKKKQFNSPYIFHPGLINGLFNIRNIKELDEPAIEIKYTIQPGDYGFNSAKKLVIENPAPGTPMSAKYRAVTFDADAKIESISAGEVNGMVSGKSYKGYLQIEPPGILAPARVLKELLLRQQNSIGGTVDCTMKLGGSEQTIKINRMDVTASFQNNNAGDLIFVAAAKGSLQLPAEGSWSVVEVDKKSGDVIPVTNKLSVPVIRKGERDRKNPAFTLNGNDGITKIAFADALLNNEATFAKRYGYVQNTGTQKLLLTDPRYDKIKPLQLITEAPLLADAYRLLKSKGPFCNIKNALQIENVADAVTDILPKGLAKTIKDFPVPPKDLTFDILGEEGKPLHMYIKYESQPAPPPGAAPGPPKPSVINYVTDSATADPAEKWKNEVSNMSVVVDMGPFKKLMTISGDFKTKSSINPGFESGNAPQLKLCPELQPIYDILEFLDSLDPTNPAEAIKKGLKIAMSNAADSWEYKFKAEKEIPLVKFPFDSINYNSPTTPLKLDAYFRIGCYFNQPIKIPNAIDELMPSAGAYLELGATLRVMCFSLAAATIYAVGKAEVGLAADIKSGPSLYFKFGFGVELCVGLPVIGDVSVMYLVGVDMKLTTEDLTVGAFLYFRGRAEIFCGIVTITIQIEAAGKIRKKLAGGPTDCIAMCTFAIDISIFLVINISFSETWEESRQIA